MTGGDEAIRAITEALGDEGRQGRTASALRRLPCRPAPSSRRDRLALLGVSAGIMGLVVLAPAGPVREWLCIAVMLASPLLLMVGLRAAFRSWPAVLPVRQVRARPGGLDLQVGPNEWRSYGWHDVTALEQQPFDPPLEDFVWYLRIGPHDVYLPSHGTGASEAIIAAARQARRYHGRLPREVHGVPDAGLSLAERMVGDEDRGLSKADA